MIHQGSFIQYVRRIFRKTDSSYPLIRTCTCACQGVRNISFSESLARVLNVRSLRLNGSVLIPLAVQEGQIFTKNSKCKVRNVKAVLQGNWCTQGRRNRISFSRNLVTFSCLYQISFMVLFGNTFLTLYYAATNFFCKR